MYDLVTDKIIVFGSGTFLNKNIDEFLKEDKLIIKLSDNLLIVNKKLLLQRKHQQKFKLLFMDYMISKSLLDDGYIWFIFFGNPFLLDPNKFFYYQGIILKDIFKVKTPSNLIISFFNDVFNNIN